jgi:hypothetical protein
MLPPIRKSTDENSRSELHPLIKADKSTVMSAKGMHTRDASSPRGSAYNRGEWKDLGRYKGERSIDQIIDINDILTAYAQRIRMDKERPEELSGLAILKKMFIHQKAFDELRFRWEHINNDDLEKMLELLSIPGQCFENQFDVEFIDHTLFQALFPIKLIQRYMNFVQRHFFSSVYNYALYIQTNMARVFLFCHLYPDTKYMPRICTEDLVFTDPIQRIRIREQTSRHPLIVNKYMKGGSFDMKAYVYSLFDHYFPNLTFRYITAGQEMHKWTLRIVLSLFELGLWEQKDLPHLASTLLQKFEGLLVLEKASFDDFSGMKDKEPDAVSRLKEYFFECREIAVSICIHIVTLMNDEEFKRSHYLYQSNQGKRSYDLSAVKTWQRAYFCDEDMSNIVHRILTTYLLQFTDSVDRSERESLFQGLNDLLMIIMDMENDYYYMAHRSVKQKLVLFYHQSTDQEIVNTAQGVIDRLTSAIENIAKGKEPEGWGAIRSILESISTEDSDKLFRYGEMNLPYILMCSLTLAVGLNNEMIEDAILDTLKKICSLNPLCQSLLLHSRVRVHWDHLFKHRRFKALTLLARVFEDDSHLLIIHRQTFLTLIGYFSVDLDLFSIPIDNNHAQTVRQWIDNNVSAGNNKIVGDIIVLFLFCRMLHLLIKFRDSSFDEKFFGLTIQTLISRPFFSLLLPIITDEQFLSSSMDGYVPRLETGSIEDLQRFHATLTTQPKSEVEIRGLLFEVAMYTMVLMNDSCQGLYSHWFYRQHIQVVIPTLPLKTEYLFKLPDYGLRYRGIVLTFYSTFSIFPGNGLMTQRIDTFPDGPDAEVKFPIDHLTGEVINPLINELNKAQTVIDTVNKHKSRLPGIVESARMYVLKGVMTACLKLVRGLYLTYSRAEHMDQLLSKLDALSKALMDYSPLLDLLSLGISPQPLLFGKTSLSQVVPLTLKERFNAGQKRDSIDPHEYGFPRLRQIRNTLEGLHAIVSDLFECADCQWIGFYYSKLQGAQRRNSPILSNRYNIEPWNYAFKDASNILAEATLPVLFSGHSKIMVDNVMKVTGLTSAEYRHFQELLDLYQKSKMEQLSRPPNDNLLIAFLRMKSNNIFNIIQFFSSLCERLFSDIINPQVDVEAGSCIEDQYYDNTLMIFLGNEIIYSFIRFFSKVLNGCDPIRTELYRRAEDSSDNNSIFYILSIMCHICLELSQICMHKTFMDLDHSLLLDRQKNLCEFFKNMCENNYQHFKMYLGIKVPKIPGLPSFNKDNKTFLGLFSTRLNALWKATKAPYNRWTVIVVSDTPECYPVLSNLFLAVSEMVNGPCPQNQLSLYKSNTFTWFELCKRFIDNVDSSFYPMKISVIDYLMALMEGDNSEVLAYFASNITFAAMFRIVTMHLKRLYIYIL